MTTPKDSTAKETSGCGTHPDQPSIEVCQGCFDAMVARARAGSAGETATPGSEQAVVNPEGVAQALAKAIAAERAACARIADELARVGPSVRGDVMATRIAYDIRERSRASVSEPVAGDATQRARSGGGETAGLREAMQTVLMFSSAADSPSGDLSREEHLHDLLSRVTLEARAALAARPTPQEEGAG